MSESRTAEDFTGLVLESVDPAEALLIIRAAMAHARHKALGEAAALARKDAANWDWPSREDRGCERNVLEALGDHLDALAKESI